MGNAQYDKRLNVCQRYSRSHTRLTASTIPFLRVYAAGRDSCTCTPAASIRAHRGAGVGKAARSQQNIHPQRMGKTTYTFTSFLSCVKGGNLQGCSLQDGCAGMSTILLEHKESAMNADEMVLSALCSLLEFIQRLTSVCLVLHTQYQVGTRFNTMEAASL